MLLRRSIPVLLLPTLLLTGCGIGGFQKHKRPSITAMPANPTCCDAAGIPFYLPKPLLVISKNFHHIEEPKVGVTGPAPIPDSFDNQSTYAQASLNSAVALPETKGFASGASGPQDGMGGSASTFSPSGAPVSPAAQIPSDGLAPHTFFTYEILFVPDLTQKYVMQIEGGAGEFRAAMNLVNGWQFTGLGPYYLKDSSTAQNVFSRGVAIRLGLGGAAEVVNSVANLSRAAAASGGSVSASDVARVAEVMDAASREETITWTFAEQATWEDEKVPVQMVATDETGRELLDAAGEQQWITKYVATGRKIKPTMENYAEIYVYEPHVVGDQMVWQPLAEHVFNREYLGTVAETKIDSTGGGSAVISNAENPVNQAISLIKEFSANSSATAAGPYDFDRTRGDLLTNDPEYVKTLVENTLEPAASNCESKSPLARVFGAMPFHRRPRVENRSVTLP